MIALLLCLPALAAPAGTVDPAGAADPAAPSTDPSAEQARYHLAQARQFQRNGWLDDSAAELQAALDLPAGRRVHAIWWMAAQIDYDRGEIPGAIRNATGAISAATTPEEREAALQFRDFLIGQFGFVDIAGPGPDAVARVLLEARTPQFDPELRARADAVAARLRAPRPVPLGAPLRIGLPAGNYTLNGHEVLVRPGETVRLDLPARDLGAAGLASRQPPRLDLLLGAALPADLSERLPAPAAGLLLSVPAGRLLIQPALHLTPARFLAGDRPAWDLRGLSAGVGVGADFFLAAPLDLRPSLSIQYRALPGVHREDPGGDLYLLAHGLGPALALTAEYRPPGGPSIGLRAEAARWWLRLPAEGEAIPGDGGGDAGGSHAWSVSDRALSALEFRLHASTGITF